MRQVTRAIGIGLIVVAVSVVTWIVIRPLASYVVPCFFRPDHFDADAWRSTDIDALCNARVFMVDELMNGDELQIGRPRAEVESLLGPTEDTEFWVSEEDGLVYITGCWIDCDWVVIEFDEDQRLTKAYTAQD